MAGSFVRNVLVFLWILRATWTLGAHGNDIHKAWLQELSAAGWNSGVRSSGNTCSPNVAVFEQVTRLTQLGSRWTCVRPRGEGFPEGVTGNAGFWVLMFCTVLVMGAWLLEFSGIRNTWWTSPVRQLCSGAESAGSAAAWLRPFTLNFGRELVDVCGASVQWWEVVMWSGLAGRPVGRGDAWGLMFVLAVAGEGEGTVTEAPTLLHEHIRYDLRRSADLDDEGCLLRPGQSECLQECGFNSTTKTILLIHGWTVSSALRLCSVLCGSSFRGPVRGSLEVL
ncbi:hypothetical protein NFI96_007418 [Prochilodus magdalenae]|nr:hypothetical protein NFI96_007418 [Prochilodus magdalenae]